MSEMANIGRHRLMELDWVLLRETRIIGDQGTTDPGGGVGGSRRCQPAWQFPVGRGLGPHWASHTQAVPPLGSHSMKDRGQI